MPNHTKPHPPANGGTTTTNVSGCQRRNRQPADPYQRVPNQMLWGRAKDKFLFYQYYFLLSTIEKDDGDRPAARQRTETQPTPPNSQHQTISNRPVNTRTRPNDDEEEEAERRRGGGGTTTRGRRRNDKGEEAERRRGGGGGVTDGETGSPARGPRHPAAATNGRKGEEEWWVGKHEGPRYHPLTTSIASDAQKVNFFKFSLFSY